jgi:tetratricopeptide (TPR) repeat protein
MEIAKEIETSLDFLNAQIRDLPERHRSMRAVFDHSWQMLSTEEKQVLSKLSVFQGGFQRQAAEQVASASLQTLSSLVIRSLLRRTAAGRYDLHELIRQYSTSKLSEDPGKLHTVYEAHSRHYLRFLEEKGVNLQSHDQKQVVADLTGEMDNIRAAWKWSVDHHQFIPLANISASLWYLFELLNWFKEGERTFRETADALRISTSESEADAAGLIAWNTFLAHYGYFLLRLGRGEEAYVVLAQSAAFLRTSTNPIAATNSLFCLGIVCWGMGRYSEAEESFRESLRFAREYEIRWYEAMVSEFLGRVAFETGAYNQARKYLYEALAILRQLGDPSMRAHLLSYLGRTMEVLGEYGEAEKLLQESLELAREIGYRLAVGLAIDGLGRVAYSQGRHEEAEANYSISTEMFREMGDLHRLSRTLNHRGLNLLSQNNAEGAQQAFKAALKMAYEGGWKPAALYALTGLTALGIPQKTSQETLELVYFILQHPASAQETKDIATRLQVKLQSDLTQVEIETVQERSKLKSLDELVTQFLAGDEISSI